jgi:hypothetical protein
MKKKALFVILLTFLWAQSQAQLSKGSIQVGGSLSMNSSSSKNESTGVNDYFSKYFSLEINPKAGVFISDKSVIGLALGFSNSSQKWNEGSDETKQSASVISFGPYYRHYFPISEKVSFFLDGNAKYNTGKSTNSSNALLTNESKYKNNGFNISVAPGFNYFVSNRWGLVVSFGSLFYGSSTSKLKDSPNDQSSTYKGGGLNLSFSSFSLGLNYFITR